MLVHSEQPLKTGLFQTQNTLHTPLLTVPQKYNCIPQVKGAVQYEVTHIPGSVFVNEYLKTGLPSYSDQF